MKKMFVSMLTAVMLLATAQSSYAVTEGTPLSKNDQNQIQENLAKLGVDKATQTKLIKKLERGEQWDSMNPEKVQEIEKSLTVTPSEPVKTYVFPDGSIIEQRISGGTQTCGTGYCTYKDVKVYRSSGVVTAQFYVNYTLVSGDYNDYISSAYNYSITTVGSSYYGDTLTIPIPQEGIGYAAEAQLRFTVQSAGGGSASTFYLKFYAGSNQGWQGANW